MSGPDGIIVAAVDFDGTLVEHDVAPLRWRPGAREFLVGAAAAGVKVWIHSCRCSPACVLTTPAPAAADEYWRTGQVQEDALVSWRLFDEMRSFLLVEGVWGLVEPWTRPGKPIADVYPDDLGALPNWPVIAAELGVTLVHAEQGGPGQVGAARSAIGPAASIPVAAAGGIPGGPAPAPAPGNDLGS